MWIQNVSLGDILKAWHYDPGDNSVLISIVDPDMANPVPLYPFKKQHNFRFLDVEDGEGQITDQQAAEIAQILRNAKQNHSNVVVHCVAGVCRSGAVTEAGVALGFQDTETPRVPNLLVKRKVMEFLRPDLDKTNAS